MKRHTSMVALAEEYLAARRRLGFRLKIEGQQLMGFARYADETNHTGPLTTELALRWSQLPSGAAPEYWSRRLGIVRRFARYRALFETETEIPAERLLGPSCRRPTPYIYNTNEIRTLLETFARVEPIDGLRPRTFVTLFGLLASTGLRISEALRLARKDVDLNSGVLFIAETKFAKSRIVPLHDSTTSKLHEYSEHRSRRNPVLTTEGFFITESGSALSYGQTIAAFRKVRDELTWRGPRPPRIHDIRHTFAVSRILRWYQDGVDVDQKMAALSTYLGHTKVSDTYWYITAVPELLAIASARYERQFSRKVQR